MSYGEVAAAIGCKAAARAVGTALKKNPILLMIPCHRVIRANGTPGGFMGNLTSSIKLRLLSLESVRFLQVSPCECQSIRAERALCSHHKVFDQRESNCIIAKR